MQIILMNLYQKLLLLALIFIAILFMQDIDYSGFYIKILSPSVNLNDLKILYVNPTGAVFTANLEISNIIDNELHVDITSYKIFIDSNEIGFGQKFSDVLPPKSVRTYKSYISIPFNSDITTIDLLTKETTVKLDIDYYIHESIKQSKSLYFAYNTTFNPVTG